MRNLGPAASECPNPNSTENSEEPCSSAVPCQTFLKDKANVIFMGGAGLGKTRLATALAYEGCLAGHTVLFTTAIDIVKKALSLRGGHRPAHLHFRISVFTVSASRR